MKNGEKLKIYYHCSTHWDREWYLPFQNFRYELEKVVDETVDILNSEPDFQIFSMDGQTIVLEDYAEVAKKGTLELEKLIKDGRVKVGPWYVMPDEFLVSGESLIRNLIFGKKVAERWGTDTWKYGYVNDVFGHIAQMPQIFNGFGIKGAYLGRGLGDKDFTHFLWKSPDGSKCYSYLGYYGGFLRNYVVKYLGQEEFEEQLKAFIDDEISKTDLPIVLITHTDDHARPDKNVPAIKSKIQELYPDAQICHVSLEEMVDEVSKYEGRLPVVVGELNEPIHEKNRRFTGKLNLIQNCLSSYYPLKKSNDICQNILEKKIEPMLVMADLFGKPLNRKYVELAYKYLLKNQPHDSICGCSVDQVHQDMLYRYDQIYQITDSLSEDFLNPSIESYQETDNCYILRVYNYQSKTKNKIYKAVLDFNKDFAKKSDVLFANEPIRLFKIFDCFGNEVPYSIIKTEHNQKKWYYRQSNISTDRYTIAFETEVPPMGYAEFKVVESSKVSAYPTKIIYGDNWAENEKIRFEISENGNISLFDKRTKKCYYGLNRFIDDAEIGDGWRHMSPINNIEYNNSVSKSTIKKLFADSTHISFEINTVFDLPIDFDEIHFVRNENTAPVLIRTTVTLWNHSDNIEISTEIDNCVKDHRLRLKLPTGIYADKYFEGQAFYNIERRTGVSEGSESYFEPETLEKNMNGIVGVRNSDGTGLAFVASKGLHEAGVDKNGDMYITLLRSFKKVRKQPEAIKSQIQQKLEYRYSIVPLLSGTTYNDLLDIQNDLSECYDTMFKRVPETVLPENPKSFLQMDSKHIAMSIFKISEDEDGYILRLFNTENSNQKADITFGFDVKTVFEVLLDESIVREVKTVHNKSSIEVAPYEIKTLKIVRA